MLLAMERLNQGEKLETEKADEIFSYDSYGQWFFRWNRSKSFINFGIHLTRKQKRVQKSLKLIDQQWMNSIHFVISTTKRQTCRISFIHQVVFTIDAFRLIWFTWKCGVVLIKAVLFTKTPSSFSFPTSMSLFYFLSVALKKVSNLLQQFCHRHVLNVSRINFCGFN